MLFILYSTNDNLNLLLELEQTQQNIEQENRLTILWNSHHELYLYKRIAFSVSCGYLNHFWKKYR